jgi:ligand-binding sensor domain-containing protein
MRGLILIWFIIWSPGAMVGQSLWYTGYGENQGLDNKDINVLRQGPNGMLWIGTMHGLYKFDGFTFSEVLYNDLNTDKAVYDLAVDDDQVLWIAGKNGFTSFNGANFIHFGQAHSSTNAEYPPRIMVSGSEIIFKDGSGSLFRVKDNKLENLREQPPGVILDWIRTGENKFWMLTENGKLHCFSDNTLQRSFDISEENVRIL